MPQLDPAPAALSDRLVEAWRAKDRINLLSHESHHRGSILLTLEPCGHALDKATRYRIRDCDRV